MKAIQIVHHKSKRIYGIMKYKKDEICYIIENNIKIVPVKILKYSSEFYTVKLLSKAGAIRLKEHRIFATEEEARKILGIDRVNRNLNEGFSPLTSDVNGIFKHSSGLMLQWGIYPSAAMTKNDGVGGYLGKITFKESFTGTPQCFTTCHYWGGNTQTGTQDISSTSVTLFSKASATDLGVRWLALGSWK